MRSRVRLLVFVGGLSLLPLWACGPRVEVPLSLPSGAGDLAVVALVESDQAGRFELLAHSQLLALATADQSLRAVADPDVLLRVVVFTYDSAALAAALTPNASAEDLVAWATVDEATSATGLPEAGRSDFVSEPFRPQGDAALDLLAASASPILAAVRDTTAVRLELHIASPDAGWDAAADAGMDSGCILGPFSDLLPVPEVSSEAMDQYPCLSADSLTLYLASERDGGAGMYDLYTATRGDTASPFGAPAGLTELNSESWEVAPWISADNLTIFFSSARAGGQGMEDIYWSTRKDPATPFAAPTNLDSVNTANADGCPFLTPDLLTLFFTSGRPGGAGNSDIWTARRSTPAAPFEAATDLAEINLSSRDWAPWLSADGRTLFFASERDSPGSISDIWFSERPDLVSPFATPARVDELSDPAFDGCPALSADGRTIYFTSMRTGGLGAADIWWGWRSCL